MTTLTEIVAAVVVHSSAVAMSHFGVTLQPTEVDPAPPPAVQRVVARTHAATSSTAHRKAVRLTACPRPRHRAHALAV